MTTRQADATHRSVACQVVGRELSGVEGDLQRAFGNNLRAYRRGRNLSQEDFAHLLGVHRTYMGGVERGERNLTLKSVERIAARLGVDPLSLLVDR